MKNCCIQQYHYFINRITFTLLLLIISSLPFYSQEKSVNSDREICSLCNGTKKVKCQVCHGVGYSTLYSPVGMVKSSCIGCSAKGWITCTNCASNGTSYPVLPPPNGTTSYPVLPPPNGTSTYPVLPPPNGTSTTNGASGSYKNSSSTSGNRTRSTSTKKKSTNVAYKCSNCNGTGKVIRYMSIATLGNTTFTTCKECGQRMSNEHPHSHNICKICNGTGRRSY